MTGWAEKMFGYVGATGKWSKKNVQVGIKCDDSTSTDNGDHIIARPGTQCEMTCKTEARFRYTHHRIIRLYIDYDPRVHKTTHFSLTLGSSKLIYSAEAPAPLKWGDFEGRGFFNKKDF